VDGTELVLHLTGVEKAEGFHRDIRVPLSAVSAVRVVDSAWQGELRGMRAPGTGLPDVIAVGTRRGGFGKDFAAVHGTGRRRGARGGRVRATRADGRRRRGHGGPGPRRSDLDPGRRGPAGSVVDGAVGTDRGQAVTQKRGETARSCANNALTHLVR